MILSCQSVQGHRRRRRRACVALRGKLFKTSTAAAAGPAGETHWQWSCRASSATIMSASSDAAASAPDSFEGHARAAYPGNNDERGCLFNGGIGSH